MGKQEKSIKELKENSVDSDIKKQASKMLIISKESITEKDINSIKKDIIHLIKDKKSELVECKKKRKKYK